MIHSTLDLFNSELIRRVASRPNLIDVIDSHPIVLGFFFICLKT